MRCAAVEKLARAQVTTGSLLSIGLEPCPEYLPRGWDATIDSHASFMRLIIQATTGFACAYKANLAFFEALGPEGWTLLERIRAWVPPNALLIADGKRGDIGTTAEKYAGAIFDKYGFDAATVNPLMGHDAVEPFLRHEDRLTFVLALTSNPGVWDFLGEGGMWQRVIEKTMKWSEVHANAGFVVGATRADLFREARERTANRVLLVPGVGAQGGEIDRVVSEGSLPGPFSGLVIHITRGILPGPGEGDKDPGSVIREKAKRWNDTISGVRAGAPTR